MRLRVTTQKRARVPLAATVRGARGTPAPKLDTPFRGPYLERRHRTPIDRRIAAETAPAKNQYAPDSARDADATRGRRRPARWVRDTLARGLRVVGRAVAVFLDDERAGEHPAVRAQRAHGELHELTAIEVGER